MKSPWRSKTLWFNAAVAVGAAAEASTSALQTILGTHAYGEMCFALAIGNAFLRVVTTQAIGKDDGK